MIYCKKSYGPVFGKGADLKIHDECNGNFILQQLILYKVSDNLQWRRFQKNAIRIKTLINYFLGQLMNTAVLRSMKCTVFYQSQKEKDPVNKEEQKFKAEVYGYLEVQQEDAENTLNKRAELESRPWLQGNRIRFSKFKYTDQNHLLEREYDDIDRL